MSTALGPSQNIGTWSSVTVSRLVFRFGAIHDLSKYGPAEFIVGVKYYQETGALTKQNAKQ